MIEFLHDTMTDIDGTLVTAHTGEVGATWAAHPAAPGQFTITANRAWSSTGGVVSASAMPPGADYTVEADYYAHSSAGNLSIFARLSPSTLTGYLFRHGGSAWQLYRGVAGSFTPLSSTTASVGVGQLYRLRFELRGASQRVYVDSVLVCEAADAEITGAGRIGLRDTNVVSATTGKHLDMIRAYVPSARTLHPVLKIGAPHIGPLRVGERN